jgi:hypothetical protein
MADIPIVSRSLLRFTHKILKNRLQGDFFPANFESSPIIGIFALLMTQKSTSATGCRFEPGFLL